MNGIFGLFNLDGAPVMAEQVNAMQSALAFWAMNGAGNWMAGEIALGCLHLPCTPEAQREQLPLQDAASGLTLTAGARLDNRDELVRQFGFEKSESQTAKTDSEIILHAYRKWSEDCVFHLEGDWHFAIWDARQQKLFLARDRHGNSGLYYFHGPRFLAFASAKKALLALDAIPKKPDLLRLAQVLTAWPGDGVRTGYEQILRLPPAHRLTFTQDGIKIDRYWFPEQVSALHLKSDDEYVEAFLEVFIQAVSARLRSQGSIGVTLSGGLDSGSVAAVAAGLLRQRGEKLVALTSVPLSDPEGYTDAQRIGDESRLAQAAARQAGDVEHLLIRAETVTPMGGIQRMLWVHDEPGHAAANQYWIAALLEAARQRDVGALLTGQMGNATISWAGGGENLLPRLLQGDLTGFWGVFEKARRGAGLSRWRGIRRFLLKPLLFPLWSRCQRAWRLRRDMWQDYSAIRPEFARQLDLRQLMAQAEYSPNMTAPDPFQQRLMIIQPGSSILGASWFEKGAAFGLEVRDPTQDRRLIELCLSIPEAQFQRDGMDRWLIRRAMQGYLPDSVRLNTRRGLQAADLGRRVFENRAEIEATLDRLNQHPLARQVLDLPRMAGVIASLGRGLTPENIADCRTILLRGLMTGLFLLRF